MFPISRSAVVTCFFTFASLVNAHADSTRVDVLRVRSAASCQAEAAAFLADRRPDFDVSALAVEIRELCANGATEFVFAQDASLAPESVESADDATAAPAMIVTGKTNIDLTAEYAAGNTNYSAFSGNAAYSRKWGRHEFQISLKGEYRTETGGATYHTFEFPVRYDYAFGTGHWSLFALASVGKNTRQEIALITKSTTGISYRMFPEAKDVALQFSVGTGHQYQEAMKDGKITNDGILSYKAEYQQQLSPIIEVIAAIYFQHVLVSGAESAGGLRVFDLDDHRWNADLKLRFKITDMGSASLYGLIEGTYEYIVKPVAAKPWDLRTKAGLGVQF